MLPRKLDEKEPGPTDSRDPRSTSLVSWTSIRTNVLDVCRQLVQIWPNHLHHVTFLESSASSSSSSGATKAIVYVGNELSRREALFGAHIPPLDSALLADAQTVDASQLNGFRILVAAARNIIRPTLIPCSLPRSPSPSSICSSSISNNNNNSSSNNNNGAQGSSPTRSGLREKELMLERQRLWTSNGVESCVRESGSSQMLVTLSPSSNSSNDNGRPAVSDQWVLAQLTTADESQVRSTPQLSCSNAGPVCTDYSEFISPQIKGDTTAYVYEHDLWVMHPSSDMPHRLTYASQPGISYGTAEFVMQEEFQRFTGFQWSPSQPRRSDSPGGRRTVQMERILCTRVDESRVNVVNISPSPSSTASNINSASEQDEIHRYPRPGTANATVELRIIEVDPVAELSWMRRLLPGHQLMDVFPWMEYLVRFGWMPSGDACWAMIMNRKQTRRAVVRIPLSLFVPVDSIADGCDDFLRIRVPTSCDSPTEASSRIEILFEESSPAPVTWINVLGTCHFLPDSAAADETSFLMVSELPTGFAHIYLINKQRSSRSWSMTAVTCGDWPVIDGSVVVDHHRQLVYFMACRETPLEQHMYVISYSTEYQQQQQQQQQQSGNIIRLTRLGYSHSSIEFSDDKSTFFGTMSNLNSPQSHYVSHIIFDSTPSSTIASFILPSNVINIRLSHNPSSRPTAATTNAAISTTADSTVIDMTRTAESVRFRHISSHYLPIIEHFTFPTSDGTHLHAMIMLPQRYMYSQQKLPILVEVYGGPRGQLVTNEFKFPRHIRSIMAVYNAGFAVLCVDGRGSANRGHEFESQITMPYLGVNEAADQVQALNWLQSVAHSKNETEVDGSVMQFAKSLDFERVAVYGWSYGGYLALKCIAHHPHTFKMAIAGSPVTDWMLYDTAYTERYLGVPSTKDPAVAARYRASSVLVDAPLFPNEPNRVLIVHGDQDENVQIEHSMKLSAELVKLGKPHTLQPFHGERHGFKSHESNIHLDTLMLYWLQNYL